MKINENRESRDRKNFKAKKKLDKISARRERKRMSRMKSRARKRSGIEYYPVVEPELPESMILLHKKMISQALNR